MTVEVAVALEKVQIGLSDIPEQDRLKGYNSARKLPFQRALEDRQKANIKLAAAKERLAMIIADIEAVCVGIF